MVVASGLVSNAGDFGLHHFSIPNKKFGYGAIAAFHDFVLIILGIFSIFNLTFDLSVLAALLAVVGYSLNDSIVVSDRIRENFLDENKKGSSEVLLMIP